MGEAMRKLFIVILIMAMVGVLGYAGYQYALGFVSEKVMDQVAEHMLDEEEVDQLLNDHEVKKWIEEEQDSSLSEKTAAELPFHTKEEALKTITGKLSVGEINEIRNKVSDGIDAQDKQEIIALLEDRLSPEELEALKIIALKELQNRD